MVIMKKRVTKVIAAASMAALTALQCTVTVFADVPAGTDENVPAVTEVTVPDVTEPDITEPDVTEPDVTEPDITEPDVTEPDVTEPDVTEPDVTEPDVTEPDVTEPDVTEPDVTEPDVTEPDETETVETTDDTAQTGKSAEDIMAEDSNMVLPDVGVEGIYTDDDDMAAIREMIDKDKALNETYSETFDATYRYNTSYFYNQLNSAERTLYNNLANACNAVLSSSQTYTSQYIDYISFDSNSISSSRLEQILYMFYYSNPQYFFLTNGYRFGQNFVYPMMYSDYQNGTVRRNAYNSINSITNTWMADINKCTNDLTKEQAIYQKIANAVSYSTGAHHQSIAGALLDRQCYGSGYAMTMTYFCNAAGLDCITVITENHAWNRVKIFNDWYEIDVSLMDQGSYIDSRYCNKSTTYFQSLDSRHNINYTVMNKYYTNITLPSCVKNDPASPNALNLKVTSAINGTASLQWSKIPGASQYNVYTYMNGYLTYIGATTGNTYTVTGLTNNVRYGFLVRYYINGNLSSYTANDVVYATPTYSPKPVITKVIPGSGQAYLTWTAVSGATNYAVYTKNNNQWVLRGYTTATSMTVTGLTGGLKYGFAVKALVNGAWSSVSSSDIVYATPTAANKPKITKVTPDNGQVTLSWSGVSGATNYAVYSVINGQWQNHGYTRNGYMTVTGLANGIRYGFAVKAYVNGAWTSVTSSDIVYATPAASTKPKITKATPDNGQVTLTWTSVNGATRYAVYSVINGQWTNRGSTTATSMRVKNLANGIKYGFAVKAYVNGAWSTVTSSDIVYATPAVSTKPKITKAAADNGQVTLTWSGISGASKYAVYSYLNGQWTNRGTTTATSMTVKNLANGIKYGFAVKAYVNGAWSTVTSSDIVYATPAVSTKPKITKAAADNGQVTLTWSGISGASKYAVYSYLNGQWTNRGTTTATSMTVKNLANGIKYGFAVKAYVNGAWSAVTSSDIVYATPTAPSSPKITSATAGVESVSLKWTAVTGASRYAIYTYINGSMNQVATVRGTSYNVQGLVGGIRYGFLVRAYVGSTWTSYTGSDIVYCTPLTYSSTPKITSAAVGNGYVSLQWTAVNGADRYMVYTYINGDYNSVATVYSTSYTVSGLVNGINYGFAVRACVNGNWTNLSSSDVVYATPRA